MAVEEQRHVMRGLELAVRVWRPLPGHAPKQNVLAWPGWLDNASSFDTIAPLLRDAGYCVVAVDPPGCGRSGHRPKWAAYSDWEEALLAIALADEALGWVDEPFVMLGHSRGGNMLALAAAAFPERVSCLVNFDGVLGLLGTHPGIKSEDPRWHRHSYDAELKIRNRPPKTFSSMDAAIERTHTGDQFPKTRQTAENLVRRSVQELPTDGSVAYVVDMRTYSTVTPPVVVEEEQMTEFYRHVQCPFLHIKADDHYSKWEATMPPERASQYTQLLRSREAAFPTYESVTLDSASYGHLEVNSHHIHSDAPREVAALLLPWLDRVVAAAPQRPAPTVPSEDGPQTGTFKGGRPAHARSSSTAVTATAARPPTAETEADLAAVPGVVEEEGEVVIAGGFCIAYKQWRQADTGSGAGRLLMVPGWLDNAGSFDTLAPFLVAATGLVCVCIDPPGSGKSDHLPSATMYIDLAEVRTIIEIADALATSDSAWAEPFLLFGHSRGGGIATVAAAGFAERIRGLIVCESGLGLAYETGVPRLSSFRAGYHADKAYAARGGRVFETFDAAVAQNRKEMAKTERTARNIVQRHVERHEDGYRITHDERQKTRGFGGWRMAVGMSSEVNDRHLQAIRCPVLLIMAKRDGSKTIRGHASRDKIRDLTVEEVEGMHHVHSDRPAAVSQLALSWLRDKGLWVGTAAVRAVGAAADNLPVAKL